MAKLTLSDLASLENETTALSTLDANNTAIEAALENTLSRDGTSPNTMGADLDMNSHRVLNLPSPVSATEPVTLAYATSSFGDSLGNANAAAASATASATSATSASTSASSASTSALSASTSASAASTSANAASTSATSAAASATTASNSVGVLGAKWNFETSTSMTAPATGGMRFDNATAASVANISVSSQDAESGNPDLDAYIATWSASTNTVKGYIVIRKLGAPGTFAVFTLASVTNNTTWLQLGVTYVAGSGTFSAADQVLVGFTRAGDKGADGSGTISGLTSTQLAIAGSATSVTSSVATSATPAASIVAKWDGNVNFSAANLIEGYTTTATAAGTTTLTVASNWQQFFTGSTTQNVKLPVTSTLVLGQSYLITNNSTGVLTVQSSGSNTVLTMPGSTSVIVTCILTSGTTAASWAYQYLGVIAASGKALTVSNSLVLAGTDGKTLTVSNSLALAGTDSTTMTFPATSSTVLTTGNNATITKGYYITPNSIGTVSSGTLTPDAANGNYQYYTNGGAHTLAAPSSDSAITLLSTNSASAGAITFSGFTVSAAVGDALTTTSTNKFVISILRINGISTYTVKALQ